MKTHLVIVATLRDLERHDDLRGISPRNHPDIHVSSDQHNWRGMIPTKITVLGCPHRITWWELEQEIKIMEASSAADIEVDWRC